jgi:hypothetical protein
MHALLIASKHSAQRQNLPLPLKLRGEGGEQRFSMELDLQSSPQLYSLPEAPQPSLPTPTPRNWAQIRGRYWSVKIDDICL